MNRCQVCGVPIEKGVLNCSAHLGTRREMVLLAQRIAKITSASEIYADMIQILADTYHVRPQTVRNHLKREGFTNVRMWRKEEKES